MLYRGELDFEFVRAPVGWNRWFTDCFTVIWLRGSMKAAAPQESRCLLWTRCVFASWSNHLSLTNETRSPFSKPPNLKLTWPNLNSVFVENCTTSAPRVKRRANLTTNTAERTHYYSEEKARSRGPATYFGFNLDQWEVELFLRIYSHSAWANLRWRIGH